MASPSATISFNTPKFSLTDINQVTTPTTIAGIAGIVALFALLLSFSTGKKARYPPGPKRLPLLGMLPCTIILVSAKLILNAFFVFLFLIVGNLLDFPKEYHWLYYKELQKKFGDIVYLKLGTNHVLLLNKPELAHEIVSLGLAIHLRSLYLFLFCN